MIVRLGLAIAAMVVPRTLTCTHHPELHACGRRQCVKTVIG